MAKPRPKTCKKADIRRFESRKISKLMKEGYPQKQAVAIALNMARKACPRNVPAYSKNPSIPIAMGVLAGAAAVFVASKVRKNKTMTTSQPNRSITLGQRAPVLEFPKPLNVYLPTNGSCPQGGKLINGYCVKDLVARTGKECPAGTVPVTREECASPQSAEAIKTLPSPPKNQLAPRPAVRKAIGNSCPAGTLLVAGYCVPGAVTKRGGSCDPRFSPISEQLCAPTDVAQQLAKLRASEAKTPSQTELIRAKKDNNTALWVLGIGALAIAGGAWYLSQNK